MPAPTFDQFAEMVEKAVDRLPLQFCRELNGGFNVMPELKRDGLYYVMAEYIERGYLGSMIVFYYGSFCAVMGNKPLPEWEKEILDTVYHEMQHHLESRAGRDDLARKEREERNKP